MSTTKLSLKENLIITVSDYIDQLDLKANQDLNDVQNSLSDLAECNTIIDPNNLVMYAHEAWDIVGGNEFNDTYEYIDLSGCETAIDAVIKEARHNIYLASTEILNEVLSDLADDIEGFLDDCKEYGFEGSINVNRVSTHGWAVHDSETINGTCIYNDLEGEKGLTALETEINGVYFSACFTKEV